MEASCRLWVDGSVGDPGSAHERELPMRTKSRFTLGVLLYGVSSSGSRGRHANVEMDRFDETKPSPSASRRRNHQSRVKDTDASSIGFNRDEEPYFVRVHGCTRTHPRNMLAIT